MADQGMTPEQRSAALADLAPAAETQAEAPASPPGPPVHPVDSWGGVPVSSNQGQRPRPQSAPIVGDQLEALREAFKAHPRDGAEAEREALDGMLAAYGMEVAEGGGVRLPPPDPNLNGNLFTRGERFWFERLGLAGAVAVAAGGRADRAVALALKGELTGQELEHLRWLATAADPTELVTSETPLTAEDARRALDAGGLEYAEPTPEPDLRDPDAFYKAPKGTALKARFVPPDRNV